MLGVLRVVLRSGLGCRLGFGFPPPRKVSRPAIAAGHNLVLFFSFSVATLWLYRPVHPLLTGPRVRSDDDLPVDMPLLASKADIFSNPRNSRDVA